jgi:hypothetical protein
LDSDIFPNTIYPEIDILDNDQIHTIGDNSKELNDYKIASNQGKQQEKCN